MSEAECSTRWIVSARERFTTLSPDRDTVFAFDLEGRPLSWFAGGRTYKRSLASVVHVRERSSGSRRRYVLGAHEASSQFAALLRVAGRTPRGVLDARARDRVERILNWTPQSLLAERERFDEAYEPVTILPPDQYLSVVAQATLGCSWSRCTFCSFYQDRSFRVRPEREFAAHLDAVRRLIGRAAPLRRGIFLADGNALMLATSRLEPLLRAVREAFPDRPVSGFVDVFGGRRRPASGWRRLQGLGLSRVAIGLESGHEPLLRWLHKPGTAADARALVETLVGAGIGVSLIVMVGVGGDRFAADHLADTLKLLEALTLAPKDILYLAPFLERAGSEYSRRAASDSVRPLDDAAQHRQFAALRDGARRALPGVRVAPYDIREFVY